MQYLKRSSNYVTAGSPRWSTIRESKWRTREVKGMVKPCRRIQRTYDALRFVNLSVVFETIIVCFVFCSYSFSFYYLHVFMLMATG